jgi:membrane associated rhomboid family serine protease
VNLLCFLALSTPTIGDYLFHYGALWPLGSPLFEPWQLVSYMFLHGGLGHIFFNLFALWIFGQAIENYWGTKRFTTYYFLTGIGAALIHMMISGGGAPTIGASGAVFGILLAFGMMFPERYIMLLILLRSRSRRSTLWLFSALSNFFYGVTGTRTGIAHFAHLGGMVVGFLLIRYWGIKGERH